MSRSHELPLIRVSRRDAFTLGRVFAGGTALMAAGGVASVLLISRVDNSTNSAAPTTQPNVVDSLRFALDRESRINSPIGQYVNLDPQTNEAVPTDNPEILPVESFKPAGGHNLMIIFYQNLADLRDGPYLTVSPYQANKLTHVVRMTAVPYETLASTGKRIYRLPNGESRDVGIVYAGGTLVKGPDGNIYFVHLDPVSLQPIGNGTITAATGDELDVDLKRTVKLTTRPRTTMPVREK